jgi:hypothetical protein
MVTILVFVIFLANFLDRVISSDMLIVQNLMKIGWPKSLILSSGHRLGCAASGSSELTLKL